MKTFTNPLDNINIASPCLADWNKMYGSDRKRFCSECKLNVYNLSAMTKTEAERLLINSEGRLCVRFYRRTDGTILMRNCPVGWAKVKQRVSRITTAAVSLIVGFFGGFLSFMQLEGINKESFKNAAIEVVDDTTENIDNPLAKDKFTIEAGEPQFTVGRGKTSFDNSLFTVGRTDNANFLKSKSKIKGGQWANGRVENIRRLEDEPVEAWIK